MLRTTVVTWAALTLAAVLGTMTPAALAQGGPKIVVDEPVFRFGEIYNDATIDHTFTVRNVGDKPLTITRIQATCGCLVAGNNTMTVPAGDSVGIPVKFDPRRFMGQVNKIIYVHSDDPQVPQQQLTLAGTIKPVLTLEPKAVFMSSLSRTEPTRTTVSVINELDQPIAELNVQTDRPDMTAEVRTIEPGKRFEVTLVIAPYQQSTALTGNVTLRTGIPAHPEVSFSYTGMPAGPVEVRPSAVVNLGELNPEQEYQTEFTLIGSDGPFDITRVESANWRFTPVVRPGADDRTWTVRVTARPPYRYGRNDGAILLRTTNSGMQLISLTVQGTLTSPIRWTPEALTLRPERGAAEAKAQLVLTADEPFDVTSATSTARGVTVTRQGTGPDKEIRFEITSSAGPEFGYGLRTGDVVIELADERVKEIRVPVTAYPGMPQRSPIVRQATTQPAGL